MDFMFEWKEQDVVFVTSFEETSKALKKRSDSRAVCLFRFPFAQQKQISLLSIKYLVILIFYCIYLPGIGIEDNNEFFLCIFVSLLHVELWKTVLCQPYFQICFLLRPPFFGGNEWRIFRISPRSVKYEKYTTGFQEWVRYGFYECFSLWYGNIIVFYIYQHTDLMGSLLFFRGWSN